MGSQAGWGAWWACSWAGQRGLLPADPGSLSYAVGSEAAQGPDYQEHGGKHSGPEPQICSHVRTQPLASCETQGVLTSRSVCCSPRGARSRLCHPGLCRIRGHSQWKSTSNRPELTRAQSQLSVGSGIRPHGLKSQFSQLLTSRTRH